VPTLDIERKVAKKRKISLIAGLDEVGRGALAGPVVAAAVVLPLNDPEKLARLSEVNDSKRLSAKKREYLYDIIIENAVAHGIGSASPIRIDNEGIMAATRHAMREALQHIQPEPEFLLIDGRVRLKDVNIPQQSVIKGDLLSMSIAAASILAKVKRDRYMVALADLYPQFGFERHKGYATPQHLAALKDHEPIALHRHSFSPVRLRLID
jgi:ribonuclease HII